MILHRHHKIPKHAGGDNSPENIVLLTIEEHAEAHRVLYEQHGRWQDRIAWLSLSQQINCAEAAALASIYVNTGKIRSDAHKAKLSALRKGKKLSADVVRRISEGHKGLKHRPETRAKISSSNMGRKIEQRSVEMSIISRQATDGHKIIIEGTEYPSHSAAAHVLKDRWGVSLDTARCRIRYMAGHKGAGKRAPKRK